MDLNSVYSGDFYANIRWADFSTGWPSQPTIDSGPRIVEWGNPPITWSNFYIYGSAHAGGFHMAFCDGSVRTVNYNIDHETHRRLSNREDGLPIDYSTVK